MGTNEASRDKGSELHISAVLHIQKGRLDDFKSIANQCIASVMQKDEGTLQYDWYLDEQNHKCVVRECYRSSDAALSHMGNLGDLLGELLAVSDLSLELFGQPSDKLMEATAGMDIKVYPFFAGATGL